MSPLGNLDSILETMSNRLTWFCWLCFKQVMTFAEEGTWSEEKSIKTWAQFSEDPFGTQVFYQSWSVIRMSINHPNPSCPRLENEHVAWRLALQVDYPKEDRVCKQRSCLRMGGLTATAYTQQPPASSWARGQDSANAALRSCSDWSIFSSRHDRLFPVTLT